MRTLGGKVARGRWGRSAAGGSLSEPLAVGDVAVLRCCTAPDLPMSRVARASAFQAWRTPSSLQRARAYRVATRSRGTPLVVAVAVTVAVSGAGETGSAEPGRVLPIVLGHHQGTVPLRSWKLPVGPSLGRVARRTIASAPSVTVWVPRLLLRSVPVKPGSAVDPVHVRRTGLPHVGGELLKVIRPIGKVPVHRVQQRHVPCSPAVAAHGSGQ
jgi:hypothetical protein